ncbi:hypothetical protein BP6252_06524 [Coleophoma cylindrospora]|uniref:PNPLA domain-containing protein n=1 Tax=Coleophoma cylindrospora TaxID=1849047 RepID=A0A3D8RMR2_9HELO|nr:hypothetical protein BP6252_06524 [Coleophoma cylindrospora]
MSKVNENRSGNEILRPCQIFDVIGGTSTGGLIAIMLGRLGMDVDECIKAYDTMFEHVFGKKKHRLPINWGLEVKPAFSAEALKSAITQLITKKGGRKEDEQFNRGVNHKCKTSFVCATSKGTSNTTLLKDYDIPGKPRQHMNMTIVEAAMATSAALSFFDPVEIDGMKYLDGGTGANNPVDHVWNEAQALFGGDNGAISNVVGCVLSIGTGNPGVRKFSNNAWKVLTETLRNLATETEKTERRFASTHSSLTATTPRYFRFNVEQGLQNVELAEYKEAPLIRQVTHEYMQHRNKEQEVLKVSEILRAKNSAAPSNIKQLVAEHEYRQAHLSHTAEIFKAPNYRAKKFVGRTAELNQLSDASNSTASLDNKPRVVVIKALGGQGKTQLALQYCYQMRGKMPVLWADAQTKRALRKDLASFASLLDASVSSNADVPDTDVQVGATLTTLQKFPTPWLMVFDNYDDPKTFNDIDNYIPSCSHGILIITTRHGDSLKWANDGFGINLDSLGESDAIELLESTLDKDAHESDLTIKKDIVNRLGKHALAVAQAGAYIKDRQLPLREFLQKFEERKENIIGNKSDDMNIYRKKLSDDIETETSMNVFATFELSYGQLSHHRDKYLDHPEDVLTLLAFFDSRTVSENLLQNYCTNQDAQLDIDDPVVTINTAAARESANQQPNPGVFFSRLAKAWDPEYYCDILVLLGKLSLTQPFSRHDNSLYIASLHPLVKDWIRIRTNFVNYQKYVSLAGTCIYRLLDLTPHPNNIYELSLPEKQELQAHLDIHKNDRYELSNKGFVPLYRTIPEVHGRPELLFGYLTNTNGEYKQSVEWFKLSIAERIKEYSNKHLYLSHSFKTL